MIIRIVCKAVELTCEGVKRWTGFYTRNEFKTIVRDTIYSGFVSLSGEMVQYVVVDGLGEWFTIRVYQDVIYQLMI